MCNTGSQLVKKSRALFPALKAGLHCDLSGLQSRSPVTPLFPALKAGLHCDMPGRDFVLGDYVDLFPALKAGLHCDLSRGALSCGGGFAFSQL